MKKLIAGLLALSLMAAPVTAYAVPIPEATDKDTDGNWVVNNAPMDAVTTITYNSSPSFMVTIPSGIGFTDAVTTVNAGIKVSDVKMPIGSIIDVTLKESKNGTDEGFMLRYNNDLIPYTVSTGDTELKAGDSAVQFYCDGDYDGVRTVQSDTPPTQDVKPTSYIQPLTFTKGTQVAKFAGSYTDSLTFEIKVINSVTISNYTSGGLLQNPVTVLFDSSGNVTWSDISEKTEYADIIKISGTGDKAQMMVNDYPIVLVGDREYETVKPTDTIKPGKVYLLAND